jgi:hypothetical protein
VKTDFHSQVNTQGQTWASQSNKSPDFDSLKEDFDKKTTELVSLRHAHGKLQKFFSEKG